MPNTLRYRNSDFYNVANLEASVVKTFSGTFTTTGNVAVWTPATGKKFVLKGFAINAVVTTVLAGTGTSIHLVDGTSVGASGVNIVWPLAAFSATQAAGSVLRQPTVSIVPYKSGGFVGTTAGQALRIVADASISTGVIAVSGIVWGDEV
jgi:hypothetical protein